MLLLAVFVPSLGLVYPIYEKLIQDIRVLSFFYAAHSFCAPPVP